MIQTLSMTPSVSVLSEFDCTTVSLRVAAPSPRQRQNGERELPLSVLPVSGGREGGGGAATRRLYYRH